MTNGVLPHMLMSVCHSWCDIVSSDHWKQQRSRLLYQRRRAYLDAEGKCAT